MVTLPTPHRNAAALHRSGRRVLKHSAVLPDLHAPDRDCEPASEGTVIDVSPCGFLSFSLSAGTLPSGTSVAFHLPPFFATLFPGSSSGLGGDCRSDDVEARSPVCASS